jgi:hypothetical protein
MFNERKPLLLAFLYDDALAGSRFALTETVTNGIQDAIEKEQASTLGQKGAIKARIQACHPKAQIPDKSAAARHCTHKRAGSLELPNFRPNNVEKVLKKRYRRGGGR